MKTIKFLGLFFVAITYLITTSTLQSCKKDNNDTDNECDTCTVLYKPNIYLYPEENIQLEVKLEFPIGGNVITSIPEYGNGWNVLVDTNGIIDNNYTYLFYESIQPDVWQKNNGWIIKRDDLEIFFNENMVEYGFYGQEIIDFVEYWIPRLGDYKYYAIYPQTIETIEDVIILNISEEPDNLLRLFYVVKGFHNIPVLDVVEPQIDIQFKRENYFVTEWGVILN